MNINMNFKTLVEGKSHRVACYPYLAGRSKVEEGWV